MKQLILILKVFKPFLIAFTILFPFLLISQNDGTVTINEKVGKTIDIEERKNFVLWPSFHSFHSAHFGKNGNNYKITFHYKLLNDTLPFSYKINEEEFFSHSSMD